MNGSGDRRKKRGWVTGVHNHSLVIVSSRTGIEAHFCLNEPSIKRRSRIMTSAL